MQLINKETKEIIDSKALAARVGWEPSRVNTYTKDGRKINGELWERIPEDAMVGATKEVEIEDIPASIPNVDVESCNKAQYQANEWVPVLEVTSEWGNIVIEKQFFSKQMRSKVDMGIYEHYNWDFDRIDKMLEKMYIDADKVQMEILYEPGEAEFVNGEWRKK